MTRRFMGGAMSILLFGLLLAIVQHEPAIAGADEPTKVNDALFEDGEELYQAECAMCHRASGEGSPPTFPALKENESLENLDLIVRNIHLGEGAMPAFPDLDAEEIAALATYIRNAWGNEFGGITAGAVAAILEVDDEVRPALSVWDGVYTAAQAERGKSVNQRHCAECHGATLTGGQFGGAPLAGGFFMHRWSNRTLETLFEYARTNMPPGSEGSLSRQQYLDVIAFVLQANGFPAGEEELVADPQELSQILIEPEAAE